jgi:mono/diheme cytochrome c family protein
MRGWTGLVMICGWLVASAHAAPPAKKVDFNRDIRPILSDICFECHGPDGNQRKGDLRLDLKDGVFRSADGVTNVVPGKPDESELYLRVVSDDPEQRMPPPKFAKQLAKEQTELIRNWIAQGAEWKGHWAYIVPARPDVTKLAEPRPAGQPAFLRTAIDQLVLAEQLEHGLKPNPEADRITLIRRLSFDLTGLPPNVVDVDAFVNDASPDAYEKLVDRLLASPHFGERMALHWLDLVRFADTAGYHSDNPRDIAPYRDYVVRSFNSNLPFDQFTREQLAGDLLPSPTVWQKVASGYNRLLQTTEEGGAQAKEYTAKYAADRVRNLGSVWLGSTLGCCECHDHKYDPFTQRDFYSLASFFADVQETAVGRREPGIPVPSEEEERQLGQLDQSVTAARKRLDDAVAALVASNPNWEQEFATASTWSVLDPMEFKVEGESQLQKQPDGSLKSAGKVAAKENYVLTFQCSPLSPRAVGGIDGTKDVKAALGESGLHYTGLRLEAIPDDDLPSKGPGLAPNGNFVLTEIKVAHVAVDGKSQPVKLARAVADLSQSGHDVTTAIDGKADTGWAVLNEIGKPHEAIFELEKPLPADGSQVTIRLEFQSKFAQHGIGRLRISATNVPQPAARFLPPSVRDAFAASVDKRNDAQKNLVVAYLRDQSAKFQPQRDEVQKLQGDRDALVKRMPASIISVSTAPRMVRMLPRGNWLDESGEAVTPAIPASLGKLNTGDRRATRLDLADWMVSSDNPLPSRVFVNRLWKVFFGQALSKSPEDLGLQGEWPTHPELLDWLSVEFRESGWNVKQLIRQIVLSGTYRQSSVLSKQSRAADPFNRLLSAQGRFRLDAEFIRDNALAISGLLSPRIGGESDRPYQPDGYWDYLNFPRRTWEHDKGERQYRRGMYTWWQRSFLHPSLLAFDAPSREECVADRPRSNTPQQALTLLNDPSYIEASRVFAARIIKDGGSSDDDRLRWAFRQAVSRPPKPEELSILAKLLAKHRDEFRANTVAAEQLPKTGEAPPPDAIDKVDLAAWTSVARTILNLHETITRL